MSSPFLSYAYTSNGRGRSSVAFVQGKSRVVRPSSGTDTTASSTSDRSSGIHGGGVRSFLGGGLRRVADRVADGARSWRVRDDRSRNYDDDDDDTARTASTRRSAAVSLDVAGVTVLTRLIDFLSALPDIEEDGVLRSHPASSRGGGGSSRAEVVDRGLTLPASAIGWLSSRLEEGDASSSSDSEDSEDEERLDSRLALARWLCRRVTHLKVTSAPWPPAPPRTRGLGRGRRRDDVDDDASTVFGGSSECDATWRDEGDEVRLLRCRPRVDLDLFPHLTVLLLDAVPPEWIVNLRAVRPTLRLLSAECGAVFDLGRFLFGDDQRRRKRKEKEKGKEEKEEDDAPLSTFPHVTHLKLTHCAVGERSRLRARPRLSLPPPLSRVPNLRTLSLSHNQIVTVDTALAGLAALPFLSTLDLSHNLLRSVDRAHERLGNLRTLLLSHNAIESARNGLDRLYSLETLTLDHNRLPSLEAGVSGLSRLPNLERLDLRENPFTAEDDEHEYNEEYWRIRVWAMFRERRGGDEADLPVLDDRPVTEREIGLLRTLEFGERVAGNEKEEKGYTVDESAGATRSPPPPPTTIAREEANHKNDDDDADDAEKDGNDHASSTDADAAAALTNEESFPQHDDHDDDQQISRRGRRVERTAVARTAEIESAAVLTSMNDHNDDDGGSFCTVGRTRVRPTFSSEDVLEAVEKRANEPPPSTTTKSKRRRRRRRLREGDSPSCSNRGKKGESRKTRRRTRKKKRDSTDDSRTNTPRTPNEEEETEPTSDKPNNSNDHHKPIVLRRWPSAQFALTDQEITASLIPYMLKAEILDRKDVDDHQTLLEVQHTPPSRRRSPADDDEQDEIGTTVVLPPSCRSRKAAARTVVLAGKGSFKEGELWRTTGDRDSPGGVSAKDLDREEMAHLKLVTLGRRAATADNVQLLKELFHDDLWWNDESKRRSSRKDRGPATGDDVDDDAATLVDDDGDDVSGAEEDVREDELPTSERQGPRTVPFDFALAETDTTYDGPDVHADRLVADDLELYFRTFVFPRTDDVDESVVDVAGAEEEEEHDDDDRSDDGAVRHASRCVPRVQLCAADRYAASLHTDRRDPNSNVVLSSSEDETTTTITSPERFVALWEEDLVTCGVAAMSRVPPVLSKLRAFHGETVVDNPRDQTYVRVRDARSFLVCLSDQAAYFVPAKANLRQEQQRQKALRERQQQLRRQQRRLASPGDGGRAVPDDATAATGTTFLSSDDHHPLGSLAPDDRVFPSPLPKRARFRDGAWPHAAARHPLRALRRVVIGFSFQRLALHFRDDERGDDQEFTYVLRTGDKKRTVAILQTLQRSRSSSSSESPPLVIENEDRRFLEVLARAAAPAVVGSVLLYQTLFQRWKTGGRDLVARVVVVTDARAYLLDEGHHGDGSRVLTRRTANAERMGDASSLRIVDAADLDGIDRVQAGEDPNSVTILMLRTRSFQRSRKWRLVCRNREGAERLADGVRNALRACR